ncbi:MAG TPA: V4R domain-containing protein [Gemmatimonadales bacterium]|nr:V4R domain-containing protein [Gemmatimonadales bacterium]
MTAPTFPTGRYGVTLGRRVLQQLRTTLERDAGLQAAAYLQEAGFAGGEALYDAYAAWLRDATGIDRPAALDAAHLSEMLSRFLGELGWGSIAVTPLGGAALALDSADWAEAVDGAGAEYPCCHLSCGLLADLLGRISGELVGVMEVECRSRGDGRCRFIAAAPETLAAMYERMAQGMSYSDALGLDGGAAGGANGSASPT